MNNKFTATVAASGGVSGQGDLSTIVDFFTSRCAAEWDDPGIDLTGCFPVSGSSFAADPMSACTLNPLVPVARVDDLSDLGNEVSFYQVSDLNPGDRIWRVSATNTLHLFEVEGDPDDLRVRYTRAEPAKGAIVETTMYMENEGQATAEFRWDAESQGWDLVWADEDC